MAPQVRTLQSDMSKAWITVNETKPHKAPPSHLKAQNKRKPGYPSSTAVKAHPHFSCILMRIKTLKCEGSAAAQSQTTFF